MAEVASPETPEVCESSANSIVEADSSPSWNPAIGIKQIFFSPMAWLNLAWPGLGNIVIGDMRGWLYGLWNWMFVFLSLFTFGVPLFLFWGFCCFRGYEYMRLKTEQDHIRDAGRPL